MRPISSAQQQPIVKDSSSIATFESSNTCLYYTNMVCTLIFLVSHIALMATLFDLWAKGDYVVIIWSSLQFALGIYSIVLTFGSVALQIVFIYVKSYVNGITFIYITTGTF